MAAADTFDWFVSSLGKDRNENVGKYIRDSRKYLLTLRSEDERQRFVEQVIAEIRRMGEDRKGT